jgi:uncharacterized protein YbaR (Trm112 family)
MNKIDTEILALLRCPVTGSRLEYAQIQLVDRINRQAQAGQLCDRAGQLINFQIDAALINADKSLAMPIRAGVVSMAEARTIDISTIADKAESSGP